MGGDTAQWASRARRRQDPGAVHALGQAGQTEQLLLGKQAQVGNRTRAASEDPATEAAVGGNRLSPRVGSKVFMTQDRCHEQEGDN